MPRMSRREALAKGGLLAGGAAALGVGVKPGAAKAQTVPAYPPNGLYQIDSFGADPAAADNGPAIQATLDAARANGGGTVLFPKGQWKVATPVVWNKADGKGGAGVTLAGMGPGNAPLNPDASSILYTGSNPGGWLQLLSPQEWRMVNLGNYYVSGYTGDLISLDGRPGGDVQHWSIEDCGFAVSNTNATYTARSGIGCIAAVIYGHIIRCGFNGFQGHGILLGDPSSSITKRYMNDINVVGGTMNHGFVSQIGIGSPDCENLHVEDVGFEGKYTAIKGLPGSLLYSPRIVGGSCEDGQPAVWMDNLVTHGSYGGTIDGVMFGALATGQTHLNLTGLWTVRNCAFNQGLVFGGSPNPLSALSNGYTMRGMSSGTPSGDLIFNSQPKAYVSLGNLLTTPAGLTPDPRNVTAAANRIVPAVQS